MGKVAEAESRPARGAADRARTFLALAPSASGGNYPALECARTISGQEPDGAPGYRTVRKRAGLIAISLKG